MGTIEAFFDTSVPVFLGVTVMLFGGAAWMTGRALALAWKPVWHVLPYSLLLGLGARFLTFALFEGSLLSLSGYLMATVVLLVITLMAYRLFQVRQMLRQYPWLYERRGPFAWRDKRGSAMER